MYKHDNRYNRFIKTRGIYKTSIPIISKKKDVSKAEAIKWSAKTSQREMTRGRMGKDFREGILCIG